MKYGMAVRVVQASRPFQVTRGRFHIVVHGSALREINAICPFHIANQVHLVRSRTSVGGSEPGSGKVDGKALNIQQWKPHRRVAGHRPKLGKAPVS